jgi:two-component system sensor histidine kinase QseC
MPALLMLPMVGGAAWWAVRSGLAPLRSLSEVLSARSPQALAPVQLAGGAPAELRAPLDALNQLLGRMATLLDGERRFTADAAHELRTPIAAVRAQAQVALGAHDAAERQHALQATLAGCDRATRLVQQLLTLARLEAEPQGRLGQADLVALARGEVAEIASTAFDEGQDLQFESPEDDGTRLLVRGEPTLLAVLLRNLIDNALRYSPEGATVRVTVQPASSDEGAPLLDERTGQGLPCAQLIVEDSGPGLSPEHLQRLGERFFRALGNDRPGSGLGWSIVRRIAMALQLEVQVDRSPDLGGLRVWVWMALAAAEALPCNRPEPEPSAVLAPQASEDRSIT